MNRPWRSRRSLASAVSCCLLVLATAALAASSAAAQTSDRDDVTRIDLPIGRSFPIETTVPIVRVSVANPEIADVVVIGARDVVVNARAAGETDVILWGANVPRRHYRILVHSPSDRLQIALYIKFAEVRRTVLREIGVSARWRDQHTRVGTDLFRSDNPIDPNTGVITIPSSARFATVLTDFGTDRLLAFLDAEETKGNARTLAEPNLLAANKEDASFLAGGELPIPIVQSSGGGAGAQGGGISILFKEFGVRFKFNAEIISDSLVKLTVSPEVSSLDFTNAVLLNGFRIPAFRTRRIVSTMDIRRNESIIVSGLFNEDRERVRTGLPYLMNIPILGQLFSSTRFQNDETELIVVVTPVVVDPLRPRSRDVLRFAPDTTLPAREALQKRLPPDQSTAPKSP